MPVYCSAEQEALLFGTVFLWDASSFKVQFNLGGHINCLPACFFCPGVPARDLDPHFLATAGGRG